MTDDNGLEDFAAPPEDQGLSLDELSQAYAELLEQGDDPYSAKPVDDEEEAADGEPVDEYEDEEEEAADEDFDISPESIVEGMLFVGHPQNEPLTSETVASFMRGVRPSEIDEIVVKLNQTYEQKGCPYWIESVGGGYQMALREEFASLRDKFYGKTKAAKLSQTAIDVLAIVAYKQPISREEVDNLRGGAGSGGILNQLVRRQLLSVERPEEKPRTPVFSTTQRFLDLFGLENIDDLPQSME